MNTIPNLLTLARLALLPVIIALIMLEPYRGDNVLWLALVLYIVAAFTDYLDGALARALKQTSAFGAFFDPVADKIFVASLLLALAGCGRFAGLWIIVPLVILAREFLISGLREYLGPKNIQIPVSPLAKWKTAFQMLALGLLIIGPVIPLTLEAGQIMLTLAAVLAVMTGGQYMQTAMKEIK